MAGKPKPFARQLSRLRKICMAMPGAFEKASHGEPTFFVKKGVFAMFSNNHHGDGHVAVWLPAPPGFQQMAIEAEPGTYYRPPYVGVAGWVGVELDRIGDKELTGHVQQAWQLIMDKRRSKPKSIRKESR